MKKTYKIDVDCANCANLMEDAARKTSGVQSATVNFMTLKMNVEFEEDQDPKAVIARSNDGRMAQRGEKMGLLGPAHPSLLRAIPAYAGDERFEGHCGREGLLCRHIKRRRSL